MAALVASQGLTSLWYNTNSSYDARHIPMTKVDAMNTCRNTSSTVSARYIHAGSAHRASDGSPPPSRVCRSGSRCASTVCSSVDITRHRFTNRTCPGELQRRRAFDGYATECLLVPPSRHPQRVFRF